MHPETRGRLMHPAMRLLVGDHETQIKWLKHCKVQPAKTEEERLEQLEAQFSKPRTT